MATVTKMIRNAPVPAVCGAVLVATAIWMASGCGLGFIDLHTGQGVGLMVQNGTASPVRIKVTVASALPAEDGIDGTNPATATEVIVGGGNSTTGAVPCGNVITVVATDPDNSAAVIQLSGDGTGTPGFDSGSVGGNGERFLLLGTHMTCGDTLVVQVDSSDAGRLIVVGEGGIIPGFTTTPIDHTGNEGPTDPPTTSTDSTKVTFRLENATATAADITIEAGTATNGGNSNQAPVRVPPGEFSQGDLDCGDDFILTAIMVDADSTAVVLTGDGTGSSGFDSASVGQDGERLVQFVSHYECGATVVVRITDDGSGIGLSTSEGAAGTVQIYMAGETVPPAVLPNLDNFDTSDAVDEITLVVVNAVESTIQVNFATGSGTLASSGGVDISSEFDVRVPPGATTVGTGLCSQEMIVAAAHLESTGTTFTQGGTDIFESGGNVNFHGVSLRGDGTGTEGFDSNSIAVSRGRLLQQDVHFVCGDTITVTVTATNNQFQLDDEGFIELDEFGNPTIQYNVGSGQVSVTR